MANEIKATSRYTKSDKLAIALACLEGVMAIILFLAEKTPGTIVTLLVLMFALSVYPIIHFVRPATTKIGLVLCVAIGAVFFGWRIWPSVTSVAAAQQPNLKQNTNGNNSPNINVPGNQNKVTVTYGNDPKLAAKLDEIERLLKAQSPKATPANLLDKYPLGYVIFDIDYSNRVFPYQSQKLLDAWNFEWNTAKITTPSLFLGPKYVDLTLPSMKANGNLFFAQNQIAEPKKVGPFPKAILRGDDSHGNDFVMKGEILAIGEHGIVFLLGLGRP